MIPIQKNNYHNIENQVFIPVSKRFISLKFDKNPIILCHILL